MPQISCLFRNVFNTNYKVCYKYKFNTPNMAKWPNLKIIHVLVPPEVLYNHMWAVTNAYNRVDFEFPVAIRASLPSATTCLERPYLLGPLGGRYIQVIMTPETNILTLTLPRHLKPQKWPTWQVNVADRCKWQHHGQTVRGRHKS